MTDAATDPPADTAPQPSALRPWQKGGPTPNPKGRGKGTPNKFSQQLVADFAADWREHGAAAIEQLRKENVAAYVKIATSLVPRELLLQFPGRSQSSLMTSCRPRHSPSATRPRC